MAGRGSSDIQFSSPGSRAFSASPVEEDAYDGRPRYSSSPRFDMSPHASSSQHSKKPDAAGSSNFMNILKDRCQAVMDAQQNSSSRPSRVGSVSQPTIPTELSSDSQRNTRSTASAGSLRTSQSREVQMLPFQTGREPVVADSGSDSRVRSASLEDFYSIDWRPKELFLKFRQQVEGFQLGANFEVNECNPKLVFKPVRLDRMWKFMCEPKHGDLRLLTKKIPIGPLLNLQVGIGHEWHTHTTGWKWKVTSAFGGGGNTHIRHKSRFPLTPGIDLRVGWNAEYILPDLHGALGTGDPAIGLNLGHLYASIERLEAIYTNRT